MLGGKKGQLLCPQDLHGSALSRIHGIILDKSSEMTAIQVKLFLELMTLVFEAEHAFIPKQSKGTKYLLCARGYSVLRTQKQAVQSDLSTIFSKSIAFKQTRKPLSAFFI